MNFGSLFVLLNNMKLVLILIDIFIFKKTKTLYNIIKIIAFSITDIIINLNLMHFS